MKIKSKNIIQVILQGLSLLLLFLPFVYTEGVYTKISGSMGHYQMKNETLISFIDKLIELEYGRFLGVLVVICMVALMAILIAQVAKRDHFQVVSAGSLVSLLLFFFYSVACTEEPRDSGWGPSYVCEYLVSFGFILIMALQVALTIIALISNSRIKQNGIIEEEKPQYIQNNNSNADELSKYKDLLDRGVITQEEFDAKKKQLLGL